MTVQERSDHIAEWVRLTAEKVAHGEHPSAGGVQPREKAISKAAREIGVNRRDAQRAVKIASGTARQAAGLDRFQARRWESPS